MPDRTPQPPQGFTEVFGSARGVSRPEDIEAQAAADLIARHGTLTDRQRIVLDMLCFSIGSGTMTATALARRSQSNPGGVSRTLESLRRRRLVVAAGGGWRATDAGRRLLAACTDRA